MEKTVYFPPKRGPLFERWRMWLRDNGVALRRVIYDTPVWVEGDQFTIVEFMLDDRGNRIYHERDCGCEHGEGHLAKHRVTYEMRIPLGDWAELDHAKDERSIVDPPPVAVPSAIKVSGDVGAAVRAFSHAALSDGFRSPGHPRPPRRDDPPASGVGAEV